MTISETLEPGSIAELAEAVRAHNHGAIYPAGCGSWMDLGYPPTKPGVAISTKRLNRIVDYPHEELTITVEAGILVSELQRILAEKGQMFPTDCPHPENATLGGLLATNTSGPRRLAYGTARDSVLGLDVIDASGTRIHGGGRVVKNVAGYDLPKMHIGALGTLGIIVEVTLKVRPMPEARAQLSVGIECAKVGGLLTSIRRSTLRPVAVELEDMGDVRERMVVAMIFEDAKEAVDFQLNAAQRLTDEWKDNRFDCEDDDVDKCLWGMMEPLARRSYGSYEYCTKLTTKPTEFPTVVGQLQTILPTDACFRGHAFNGVLWALWTSANFDAARESMELIRRSVAAVGGRFTIPRCPNEWKCDLPIWGDVGPEIEWMRRLRTALDPDRVINPGRFVVE